MKPGRFIYEEYTLLVEVGDSLREVPLQERGRQAEGGVCRVHAIVGRGQTFPSTVSQNGNLDTNTPSIPLWYMSHNLGQSDGGALVVIKTIHGL